MYPKSHGRSTLYTYIFLASPSTLHLSSTKGTMSCHLYLKLVASDLRSQTGRDPLQKNLVLSACRSPVCLGTTAEVVGRSNGSNSPRERIDLGNRKSRSNRTDERL